MVRTLYFLAEASRAASFALALSSWDCRPCESLEVASSPSSLLESFDILQCNLPSLLLPMLQLHATPLTVQLESNKQRIVCCVTPLPAALMTGSGNPSGN